MQSSQAPYLQDLVDSLNSDPKVVSLMYWLQSPPADKPVTKYNLPNKEVVSCVQWKNRFYLSSTDIVKIVTCRLHLAGRKVANTRKFAEGIFSDLRNLKAGVDAVLEQPRSDLLTFLHQNGCIRTKKKQKVYLFDKVPHDKLFKEALERDMRHQEAASSVNPSSPLRGRRQKNNNQVQKNEQKCLLSFDVMQNGRLPSSYYNDFADPLMYMDDSGALFGEITDMLGYCPSPIIREGYLH